MTEQQAIRRICRKLIEQGYLINVEDGNGSYTGPSNDLRNIVAEITAFADDCSVRVHRRDNERIGSLLFVFGNAPDEVLADWSCKDGLDGPLGKFLDKLIS